MFRNSLRKTVSIMLIIVLAGFSVTAYGAEKNKPKPYDNCYIEGDGSNDISQFDFRNDYDLLTKLTFGTMTKWPAKDKMPTNFSPKEYLEWGKDPGLGIRELHNLGYTGKGVNVAYIDQPLGKTNPANKNVDLHYYKDIMVKYQKNAINATSMHGPAVLSLLAGKEIGVAPEATVHFVANPSWLADQKTHADAIYEILEVNKKLPKEKRIKVIGFSDNIDSTEKNPEAFEDAVKEAEAQGIYFVFANNGTASVNPFSNRNNPNNYNIEWTSGFDDGEGICIPVDRTTAVNEDESVKWARGGTSWTAPYVVGLMAIGLQINPNLTGQEVHDLIRKTVTPLKGVSKGGLVNPKGFVEAVKATLPEGTEPPVIPEKPVIPEVPGGPAIYTLFVYNSERLSADDFAAIKKYAGDIRKTQEVEFLDTKGLITASQIYDRIGEIAEDANANPAGIQIFGTDKDVPAFNLNFKVQMQSGIDEGGTFKSDFFYGNLNNDSKRLDGLSIYAAFENKMNIDFMPAWPIARLPLTKGDYSDYFAKADDYQSQLANSSHIPLVNFSNPIFGSSQHIDDMGYFIKNRIDKEFGILCSDQYTLYGNKMGNYPVRTEVKGDASTENLRLVNQKGISDILINGHGQKNNLDKTYFENREEKRISLVNSSNINEVLGANYYNLMTWSCNNGYGMDDDNLTYKALTDGKAINVFSATATLSNNGVRNNVSLEQMKKNNFFYFYYTFMKNYYSGANRSESFWLAKRAYTKEILNNSDTIQGEGNYQFNLNNVLIYHHFGLLDSKDPKMKANVPNLDKVVLKNVKKYNKSKVKISWMDIKGESGYQVYKMMKKSGKYVVISKYKTKKSSMNITAKRGTKYYYKVRAYKNAGSKTVYAPWSVIKSYKL